MTQMMIEQLTEEEYSNLLAYGDPVAGDTELAAEAHQTDNDSQEHYWISTLVSTTYPGMTFGYNETVSVVTPLCISTAV